jgi:hypothetical protein
MIDIKACIDFLIIVTLGSEKSRTALGSWIVFYQMFIPFKSKKGKVTPKQAYVALRVPGG